MCGKVWTWKERRPFGSGPNPRRRQALARFESIYLEYMLLTKISSLIRVGNRIFLFGGTSPYHGPPLYFTPEQLALLPHQEEDQTSKVIIQASDVDKQGKLIAAYGSQ